MTSCGGSGNRAGRLDPLRQLRAAVLTHQDAEAVLCHAAAGLQGRNQGLRSPQVRGCLLHVKFRDQALSFPQGGDPERFLLKFEIFPGKFEAFLIGPHLDVVRRHLGLQKDQDVVVALHLGVEVGVGGLDRAAEPPPEIEFPGSVEAGRPVVVIVGGQQSLKSGNVERIGSSRSSHCGSIGPAIALLLGEQVALGNSAFRPGLQDAAAGHFQREVLLRSLGNQLIERRVAKRRPPAGVVTLAAPQVGVAGVDPRFRDIGLGRTVVRANFETIVPPLAGARTARHRKNQDQESCPVRDANQSA